MYARIYVTDDGKTHFQEEEEERLLNAAIEEGEDEVDESDEIEHVSVSRVRGFVVIIQLGEEGNDLARGVREVARVVVLNQFRQILLNEVTRLSLRRDAQTKKEMERLRNTLRRPHRLFQLLRLQELNHTIAERALSGSGHVIRIRRVHLHQNARTVSETRRLDSFLHLRENQLE